MIRGVRHVRWASAAAPPVVARSKSGGFSSIGWAALCLALGVQLVKMNEELKGYRDDGAKSMQREVDELSVMKSVISDPDFAMKVLKNLGIKTDDVKEARRYHNAIEAATMHIVLARRAAKENADKQSTKD